MYVCMDCAVLVYMPVEHVILTQSTHTLLLGLPVDIEVHERVGDGGLGLGLRWKAGAW